MSKVRGIERFAEAMSMFHYGLCFLYKSANQSKGKSTAPGHAIVSREGLSVGALIRYA